ncbi:MAG: hypothetical protein LBI38_00160 [Oscillospiraceae bacterium]|jgi:hypothetical protein|nr:hypothetical protein [Oscillospiraceae bacterium]
MTFIEKIDRRFPKLGDGLKKFSEKRGTTVWQDMLLCTAVTFACAFYEYEKFLPAFATNAIKSVLVVLFVFCWLWCAFLNGFWKKYGFLIYAVAFWAAPRLIVLKKERAGIIDYNKYLDAAAQFSRLITDTSLARLSDLLDTPAFYTAVSLLAWCLALFYAGTRFRKCFDKNNRL